MKNNRILFLGNSGTSIFTYRKEMICELMAKGFEIYVCIPKSMYLEELRELCCKIIECKYMSRHGKNPFVDLLLIRFYKKIIKGLRPLCTLSFTIKCNSYGGIACKKLKIPFVPNVTGLGTAVANKSVLQPIAIQMYKRGIKDAFVVFFQNQSDLEFMRRHNVIKKAPFFVLPGSGVNLTKNKLLPFLDEETVEFVFPARILKEKGIVEYLEAAKKIKAKHQKTIFHVCGECENDLIDILNEYHQKGIIVYHGQVKNLIDIYSKCQCVVLPTYYPEGMSNVLLEACATGRAILTTNRPGCREILDDGINGFLVKEKDADDLASKIEIFLDLPFISRKNMGLAGRRKVEKEFDRNFVVAKYLEIIDSISNQ